jgi:hypothetical protein
MENIVFLANYPGPHNIKDGMSQRILAIDKHFTGRQRIYLNINYKLSSKKQIVEMGEGLLVYRCHILYDLLLILQTLRRARFLYFHSVYNVVLSLPFLFFIKKSAKIIWDVHGIVPEEQALSGNMLLARLCSAGERFIAGRAEVVIVVTNQMKAHLLKKYPFRKTTFITYAVLPASILEGHYEPVAPGENDELIIVYSGNTQVWQKISLMMEVIQSNSNDHICFYILTGEPDTMKGYLAEKQLFGRENIKLLSVAPDQLASYYRMAHYGFILRDDIAVNRVACPTKMVEYLFYGVIPIVLSNAIGDFPEHNYEFVEYTSFNTQLQPRKSFHNIEIVRQMVRDQQATDLVALIEEALH